ncbi:MAG: hypothetical protein RL341_403 [Pseudomonadota bacterium]|jgi:hypothetical protein
MSAYLDTPQAIKRRRAFMHALVPLIGKEKSLQTVALWEETLGSDQPLLRGIPAFVNLAVGELEIAAQPKDLAYALMQSLGTADSELPPDPKSILASGAGAKPASPAAQSRRASDAAAGEQVEPINATLGALLLALVDGVGRTDRSAQKYAVDQFISAADSAAIAADLKNLLNGKSSNLQGKYSEKQAASLVNTLYIQIANAAGPVSADRILTQAVTQVEASPAGFRFAPRALL